MPEILDQTQIHDRFPAEWVLLSDPQTNDVHAVERGVVLFHSKDREEVYRKARELRPGRFAVVFTGNDAKDMEFLL